MWKERRDDTFLVSQCNKSINNLEIPVISYRLSQHWCHRELQCRAQSTRRPGGKQLLTLKRTRTEEDWRKVLFSDESHHMVSASAVNMFRAVLAKRSMSYRSDCETPRKRIIFWSCFSYHGFGFLPEKNKEFLT